jgi:hypothetical protein
LQSSKVNFWKNQQKILNLFQQSKTIKKHPQSSLFHNSPLHFLKSQKEPNKETRNHYQRAFVNRKNIKAKMHLVHSPSKQTPLLVMRKASDCFFPKTPLAFSPMCWNGVRCSGFRNISAHKLEVRKTRVISKGQL